MEKSIIRFESTFFSQDLTLESDNQGFNPGSALAGVAQWIRHCPTK